MPQAAVSSGSIPFVFEPHHWKGRGTYMDGGTVYNINVEGAIRQCLDLVDDESKIVIDVYICGAPTGPDVKETTSNGLSSYLRGRTIR